MATCFGCIRRCFNAGGFNNAGAQVNRLPTVVLDMLHMGQDVVIVKNGQRICGSGAALANAPLVQNKSYFEVKLQQNGLWGLGVATQKTDLNRVPLGQDLDSCVLTSDATVLCNREVLHKLQPTIQEGDVIGVSYDHLELNFYLNGADLHAPVTGVKGEVYPVLYATKMTAKTPGQVFAMHSVASNAKVDDGAILDAVFTSFYHSPPPGFEQIMVEQSLL